MLSDKICCKSKRAGNQVRLGTIVMCMNQCLFCHDLWGGCYVCLQVSLEDGLRYSCLSPFKCKEMWLHSWPTWQWYTFISNPSMAVFLTEGQHSSQDHLIWGLSCIKFVVSVQDPNTSTNSRDGYLLLLFIFQEHLQMTFCLLLIMFCLQY